MRTTYDVVAKRWRRGWELHIKGVGVTQSHTLSDAEAMARDYIVMDLDVPEDSVEVRVTPQVGDGVDKEVAQTRSKIAQAARAQSTAAESSRALVRRLKALGLSGKDMAVVLGITPQRVSQLAGARAKQATTTGGRTARSAAVKGGKTTSAGGKTTRKTAAAAKARTATRSKSTTARNRATGAAAAASGSRTAAKAAAPGGRTNPSRRGS